MSAAATLHRSTTAPVSTVVECWVCTRWGRWVWRENVVIHGPKAVCVLPEPARKKEARGA